MRISCGLSCRPAHKPTFHSALRARCGRAETGAPPARRLHARVRRHAHAAPRLGTGSGEPAPPPGGPAARAHGARLRRLRSAARGQPDGRAVGRQPSSPAAKPPRPAPTAPHLTEHGGASRSPLPSVHYTDLRDRLTKCASAAGDRAGARTNLRLISGTTGGRRPRGAPRHSGPSAACAG